MAVTDWIDEVAKAAGGVKAYPKGYVKSFWCFKRTEFPEAITEFPSAISYVQNMRLVTGGESGPTLYLWRGVTEFHILPGTSKAGLPEVMRYYDRIVRAFLLHRTLGGKVASFSLLTEGDGEAITAGNLTYGTGETAVTHLGLVAYWKVKEVVSGVVVGN